MPEAAYFTFIHTPYYQARAKGLLRHEDQIEVERLICENPEAGDQQAGVRKLRVRLKEKGKSGGVRVIYFCIEKRAVSTCWTCSRKAKKRPSQRPNRIK